MKIRALFLAAAALLGTAAAKPLDRPASRVSYDGYRVYRVSLPGEAGESDVDASLAALGGAAIELRRVRRDGAWAVDLAVAPDAAATFEEAAASGALTTTTSTTAATTTILSHDLGAELAAESSTGGAVSASASVLKAGGALLGLEWFDAYHAYADHVRYWAALQAALPANSELIVAGTSFEGRPIQGIHLWGKGGKDSRPAIYFNGNVHAREWITSMVVEYILYQLVTRYNKRDKLVQKVLDNYDFYVLPVVNPDGFVYTQTTDRLWRKNRQTRSNATAVGTDINRNWSVGWGGDGSSPTPSSETFSGFAPLDTPEAAALAALAVRLRDRRGVKLYVDWHSYAQVILLSYGYTCTAFPANLDEQTALAAGIAAAIAKPYNTTFDYGPGCLVLYQSSGNGRDYLTDVGKAQFGWGIELRDTRYGFVLPPEQILPSGIEIWEGLKYAWSRF
ncbi:hypothetical protein F4802DRAFT_89992 [Xylaria palmicola]|nr:hypothetical protein F4802DRAFT_89992 [Xylaria palmicola]